MQSRNASVKRLMRVRTAQCMQCLAVCACKTHRFLLVSVHASSARDDVFASPCDASRLPRWLVWCCVLSARQEMTRSQDLSFLGPQKRRIRSLRNEHSACASSSLWSRDSGQQKSAALTIYKALMPDLSSLLGIVGGAVLAIYLVRYYREHYTRTGWLRSGQEASHRLHRA